jgi:LAO/AO transport system kinase
VSDAEAPRPGGPALDLKSIRALSRAISIVENRSAGCQEILARAYRAPQKAMVTGVTGPPGAGKSTLLDALAEHWARAGEPVAVLAVDPSSPFSGGAVLGDRVRMDRSANLPGVYFRSVSARGEVGGLSASVCDILAVLNQAGFRRIVIETVGAGQSDIAIAEAADCTLVVGVPGLGDDIQASKAGLMEIGDVYVVNKSDLPGAAAAAAHFEGSLSVAYAGEAGVNAASPALHQPQPAASPGRLALMHRHGDPAGEPTLWRPPVHLVNAIRAEGIAELAASVDAFLAWCEASGRLAGRRRSRIKSQILRELAEALIAPYVAATGAPASLLSGCVERVLAGEMSPSEAVKGLERDGR